jgi:hypothetical protein
METGEGIGGCWILDTGYWDIEILDAGYLILGRETNDQHPESGVSIQHPASSIQHLASSIKNQVSGIQYRAFSIQHP